MTLVDISKTIKAIKKRYKDTGGNITQDEHKLLYELADEFNRRVIKAKGFKTNPEKIGKHTLNQAKVIAVRHGHRIKTTPYNEYVITGPWFPTGYFTHDIEDAINTLMFEVDRHSKKNPSSGFIVYTSEYHTDVGPSLDKAFERAKAHSRRFGESYLYDKSRDKMIAHFVQGILTQETKQSAVARSVKYQHKGPQVGLKNPRGVLIYGKVNRIIATKLQKHICDAECKKHGHRYFHDFTSRAKMYGLPNGDLLITTR